MTAREEVRWPVQPAAATQAQALAAIHAACFSAREAWGPDAIGLQLAMPGAFGFVAGSAGMILARVAADEAEVLTLAVLPDARRQGAGEALLGAVMAEARRRGAAAITLEVAVDNIAARVLYERAGFAEVGRRPRYYADGADALVLQAAL